MDDVIPWGECVNSEIVWLGFKLGIGIYLHWFIGNPESLSEKFSEVFDANTYILMTKAMDGYDAAGKLNGLENDLEGVTAELLIIGFYSDWLYPPQRGKEIQRHGGFPYLRCY